MRVEGQAGRLRRRLRRPLARAWAAVRSGPDVEGPACRAPFTSLHIDQFGDARPCCQSSRVLGNVADQTLDEIWTGPRLAELRDAIAQGDLSLGCEHCAWAGRGGRETTYAVRFDHDRLPAPEAGPVRLELAPSNSCNLQCAMCNGDWSSSIRLHREGRPALPRRFGERQLEEVRALAPGLDELHLFGGEPFLMPEALALLDIAAEAEVRCTVTTNGSVFTPRIERLLDRPGIDLVVSVDGASPEVYESIRRGATWVDLEAHLDRFQELARRHGNQVDLAHCLMTANWTEFADHLRWAHARGLGVYVNDVLSPEELSLHHLPPPELAAVVDGMARRTLEVAALGGAWAATWDRALAVLRQTLDDSSAGARHDHLGKLDPFEERTATESVPLADELQSWRSVHVAEVVLRLGADLVVEDTSVEGDPTWFGIDASSLVGRTSPEVRTLAPEEAPEARQVLAWGPDRAVEERRFIHDGRPITERRTVERESSTTRIRFAYRGALVESVQEAAVSAAAAPGDIVIIDLDEDRAVAAVDPAEVAARLGLRHDLVGRPGLAHEDLLRPELLDPPPTMVAGEIEPGIVAVRLRWPDGRELGALADATRSGVRVRLFRPKPESHATDFTERGR